MNLQICISACVTAMKSTSPLKAELRGTLDALKQSLRENNVDISLVLPIATNVKQSTTINNFAASINGIDGIYSLGSLHPMQSDWESVLYDIKEKGLDKRKQL